MLVRAFPFLLASLVLSLLSGCHREGELSLPSLSTSQAHQEVNLNLGPLTLWMAGIFLPSFDPDAGEVKKLIRSLKAVHIRSYKLSTGASIPEAKLAALRNKMARLGWSHLVESHSAQQHEDVDVYVSQEGEYIRGVTVLVRNPEEVTMVNVVGRIDGHSIQRLKQMASRKRAYHEPAAAHEVVAVQ